MKRVIVAGTKSQIQWSKDKHNSGIEYAETSVNGVSFELSTAYVEEGEYYWSAVNLDIVNPERVQIDFGESYYEGSNPSEGILGGFTSNEKSARMKAEVAVRELSKYWAR